MSFWIGFHYLFCVKKKSSSINDGNILEHANVQIKDKFKYYDMEFIRAEKNHNRVRDGLQKCSQVQFVEKWICEASFSNEDTHKKKVEKIGRYKH